MAAAPRAVPDSLALGYALLLIVEERQLAQSLAVAHNLAAYLVTTLAQELVREWWMTGIAAVRSCW